MTILEKEQILSVLKRGILTLEGEFLLGSNDTFFLDAQLDQIHLKVVYKPVRGERPLWDFPRRSLAKREVAAYLVSEALGWELVPPTVFRTEGPAGAGSLQIFIDHDPNYHFFNFLDPDRRRLEPVVVFDLLVNNADRKGSHLILDENHHIWSIDHGVCFHVEDKVRTVLWDFAGLPIPGTLLASLEQFSHQIKNGNQWMHELCEYLTTEEISALQARAQALIQVGKFPNPPEDRRSFPWPPI